MAPCCPAHEYESNRRLDEEVSYVLARRQLVSEVGGTWWWVEVVGRGDGYVVVGRGGVMVGNAVVTWGDVVVTWQWHGSGAVEDAQWGHGADVAVTRRVVARNDVVPWRWCSGDVSGTLVGQWR